MNTTVININSGPNSSVTQIIVLTIVLPVAFSAMVWLFQRLYEKHENTRTSKAEKDHKKRSILWRLNLMLQKHINSNKLIIVVDNDTLATPTPPPIAITPDTFTVIQKNLANIEELIHENSTIFDLSDESLRSSLEKLLQYIHLCTINSSLPLDGFPSDLHEMIQTELQKSL